MSRPKGDAGKRLLDAARALAREKGCAGISVRDICRRAKVNTGLFHYHFKSRRAFVERIMEDTYADFFSRLTVSADGPGTAAERLRRTLRAIALFSRENRRLYAGMLRDALNGDTQTARFAASHFPRHIPIILGLVAEGCRAGEFRDLPEPMAMSYMMGVLSTPILVVTLLEDHGAKRPLGRSMADFADQLLSDRAIETRVDMILAGLARPRRRA
ncbi:MAG: TetR family transcriptional regulator [Elusimicrobiota bacterium]|nr:MAG: TetR family transcriptional regulator [Elusimicrobiota bacterium]